jgi:hypothetical protein
MSAFVFLVLITVKWLVIVVLSLSIELYYYFRKTSSRILIIDDDNLVFRPCLDLQLISVYH